MIKINNVSKKYKGQYIYMNFNLEINESEVTFILGKSGCGKSTLLNLIGGIDDVDTGEILYIKNGSKDIISSSNYCFICRHIGFVFQDFNLIDNLSIKKNVLISQDISKVRFNLEEVKDLIKKFNIKNINQSVNTLSGGEKQRVAILKTIYKKADIILADEPTGNLDGDNSKVVIEELIKNKTNHHIVIVTHDEQLAQKYGDRIVKLEDGKIIDDIVINRTDNKEDINKFVNRVETRSNLTKIIMDMFLLFSVKLKNNLMKVLFLSILVGFAFSSFLLATTLNDSGAYLSTGVNNYLESDLLSLYYKGTFNYSNKEKSLNSADVQKITNDYLPKKIISMYLDPYGYSLSVGKKVHNSEIKIIDSSDFFKNRMSNYLIEGSLPCKLDEIVISNETSEYLNINLNDNVQLNNSNGINCILKVVGINSTLNANDDAISILLPDTLKQLQEQNIKKTLETNVTICKEILSTGVTSGGIKALITSEDCDLNVIYGQLPQNNREIMISTKVLEKLLKKYSEEDINSGLVEVNDLDKIYSKRYCFYINDSYCVKISGIYECDDLNIFINENFYKELLIVKNNVVDIYLGDYSHIDSISKSISNEYDFYVHCASQSVKDLLYNNMKFFTFALIALTILISIILLILIFNFIRITFDDMKKTIAILKSMGLKNKFLNFIMIFDQTFIAIVGLIFSIILSNIITLIFNNLGLYISIKVDYSLLIYIFIVYICISIILSLLIYSILLKKNTKKIFLNLNR